MTELACAVASGPGMLLVPLEDFIAAHTLGSINQLLWLCCGAWLLVTCLELVAWSSRRRADRRAEALLFARRCVIRGLERKPAVWGAASFDYEKGR